MIERVFTEKINRENRWKWITAFMAAVAGVGLTFSNLALTVGIQDPFFWQHFFFQGLIVLFACGVTWALRDAQRHDLYVQIRQHSVTQLRRFAGEIQDEIERLEVEQSQYQEQDRKIKKLER
jgi:hypothetical protein